MQLSSRDILHNAAIKDAFMYLSTLVFYFYATYANSIENIKMAKVMILNVLHEYLIRMSMQWSPTYRY